jgi:D-hexose-6-phosphate mutarotase
MFAVDLQALNDDFSIPDHLSFAKGMDGLPVAEIRNVHGSAGISLYGGQVLTYRPAGATPVLWLSPNARYEPGRAIRGGIPVCWPWFGPHPHDRQKPDHGFARTSLWRVWSAAAIEGGVTELRLSLHDDAETRRLWPHAFQLRLVVSVGPTLTVELITRNIDAAPFAITAALHSYIAVSDVGAIRIEGLDGRAYLDKPAGYARRLQHGPVTFAGETDRIYLDTTGDSLIDDPGAGRRIRVAKAGSRTTVVWSPGPERARAMADIGVDAWRGMVCVEAANTADDAVLVPPGGEHRLRTIISVEALPD